VASIIVTVDLTAPTVLTHLPVGTAVAIDAKVVVTFSEAMDHALTTMIVGGVQGSLAWVGNQLTFTPSLLAKGTGYTVTVTGNDLAGNAMTSYQWSFTTIVATGNVIGVVLDEDGNPIAGASVLIDGIFVVKTNASGGFDVPSALGVHTLTISMTGYSDQEMTITVIPGENDVNVPDMASTSTPSSGGDMTMIIVGAIAAIAVVGVLVVVMMRKKK
jgi:hypothetical protein